jgi:hypothetical protein
MPAIGKKFDAPTNDFEWSALSDEELVCLDGQRANSERIARQASRDLQTKMDRLSPERLAVSLKDLNRMVPEVRRKMTEGKLDLTEIVRVGEKENTPALAFSCDLLTAATICDIIRSEDRRVGDTPTGVWIFRRAWTRVGGGILLTIMVDGEVRLNPEVFSVEVEVVAPAAPTFNKV